MGKQFFMTILVAVLGVVLGVGFVAKQARESKMNFLVSGNQQILAAQKRLEKSFKAMGREKSLGNNGNLEKRVAALENQLDGLQGFLKQLKAGPQAAGPGNAGRQGPPPEDFSKKYDIPVDHSIIIGKKDAPITLVEFIDFQCPYCARFHPPLAEVLKAYPDKVNVMVKNFPLGFHPQAKPAAKASFAAAEQGKYREMVDALLANGRSLSEDKFKELAQNLGLDVEKFMKDYKEKDAQWEEYIKKDMALGAKVGVRGTPSFYLNGRKTRSRDFNGYKQEIDKILLGK